MNNILRSIWLQAWVDGMKHRSSCCHDRTFLDRNIQLFEILLRYVDNVIFSPEAKIIFFSSFKIHFCIRYSWIWMQIDDVSQSQAVRNRMTCLHRPWAAFFNCNSACKHWTWTSKSNVYEILAVVKLIFKARFLK